MSMLAMGVELLVVLVLSVVVSVEPTLVDLTHDLTNDTKIWPSGQWKFTHYPFTAGMVGEKFWFEGHNFRTGEHVGTHMDAPRHFYQTGWTIDQIPPERFIAPLAVIDIQERVKQNRDAFVTRDDLLAWEQEHGGLPRGVVVLQCSGWDQYWGDEVAYLGNDKQETMKYHSPGFHVDAVRLLVERGAVGIGSDTISIDAGNESATFPSHVVMCSNFMYGLENLKGVCRVPAAGATLFALPLKLQKGSGCPTRVLARWGEEEGGSAGGASVTRVGHWVLVTLSLYFLFQQV